jgi:hypothetical protein
MGETEPVDVVANEEILYRSVPEGRNWVKLIGGECKPSAQAFNDKDRQPSVDRAKLLAHDPVRAKMQSSDGILQLKAGDVREEKIVKTEKQSGQPEVKVTLSVDIVPDPTKERPAHALVKFHPLPGGTSNFEKLKERLALLSSWAPQAEIENCR